MLMSMSAEARNSTVTTWQRHREARDARIEAGSRLARGKIVEARDATRLMEAVIRPGDRVCLEGNNQKQADFLAQALRAGRSASGCTTCTWCSRCWRCPSISTCSRTASPTRLDFCFSGPQGARLAPAGVGGTHRDRRDPHLPRAVRALLRRPDAERGAGRRAGGRSRRQPLHRPEHRRHAGHRRGHGVLRTAS